MMKSAQSKFSRPSLVGSLELKPSKDISSVSVKLKSLRTKLYKIIDYYLL